MSAEPIERTVLPPKEPLDNLVELLRQRHQRRQALDDIIDVSEDADLYEITSTPRRTR